MSEEVTTDVVKVRRILTSMQIHESGEAYAVSDGALMAGALVFQEYVRELQAERDLWRRKHDDLVFQEYVRGLQAERGLWRRKHDDLVEEFQTQAEGVERLQADNRDLENKIKEIRSKLEEIVCTVGEDAGVVLLSQDGPTHVEEIDGRKITVYDLEYFSPLGEALMAAWKLTRWFECENGGSDE